MVDKLTVYLTKEEFGAAIGAIKEQSTRLEEHANNYVKDEKSLEETKSAIKHLVNAEIEFTRAWNRRAISGVAHIRKELKKIRDG